MFDTVLLIGGFLFLIMLRVPIAFALAASSMVTIYHLGLSPVTIANQMFTSVNSFTLLAVPFFLFLGKLMNEGGITDRLLKVADVTVGPIRGGLGHVNVLVSMLFGCISGSAAADTASIGSVLIPAMKKAGYNVPYTVAITACSSTLGMIIPPSILMVLYGAFGNVSIGALFIGGIIPGILIGGGQMAYTYFVAVKSGMQPSEWRPLPEVGMALYKAIPPMLLPIIILGGIMTGVFTATEAAAVAVMVGLFLALFVFHEMHVIDLPRVFAQAVVDYSLPMFCVAAAGVMGWLIAYLNIATDIANFILSVTDSPFGVLMMISAFLVIVGTVLSPVTAVIIFLPIIQKLGTVAGINDVHLGLIVILSLTTGLVTPPYGISLLIACQIAEISATRAFVAVIPVLCITFGMIALGALLPDLLLFLPKLVMPEAFAGG